MLLATRSEGKLRELRALFAARRIVVVDLVEAGIAESPEEDGLEVHASFEANALAKARHFASLSDQATVADDSGLCVSALGGGPGVMSKRWSGRMDLSGEALDAANNHLLLSRLHGAADRSAQYVCAAAYVSGRGEVVCRGEVRGFILEGPRGAGGFGYDPYFAAAELDDRTFGEVSGAEKARVSHRARAFEALLAELERRRWEQW